MLTVLIKLLVDLVESQFADIRVVLLKLLNQCFGRKVKPFVPVLGRGISALVDGAVALLSIVVVVSVQFERLSWFSDLRLVRGACVSVCRVCFGQSFFGRVVGEVRHEG